jgi:hypothetical protein
MVQGAARLRMVSVIKAIIKPPPNQGDDCWHFWKKADRFLGKTVWFSAKSMSCHFLLRNLKIELSIKNQNRKTHLINWKIIRFSTKPAGFLFS